MGGPGDELAHVGVVGGVEVRGRSGPADDDLRGSSATLSAIARTLVMSMELIVIGRRPPSPGDDLADQFVDARPAMIGSRTRGRLASKKD